jgi:hypothetical protein
MFTLFTLQVKGIILERFTYKFRPCVAPRPTEVEHALVTHVFSVSVRSAYSLRGAPPRLSLHLCAASRPPAAMCPSMPVDQVTVTSTRRRIALGIDALDQDRVATQTHPRPCCLRIDNLTVAKGLRSELPRGCERQRVSTLTQRTLHKSIASTYDEEPPVTYCVKSECPAPQRRPLPV